MQYSSKEQILLQNCSKGNGNLLYVRKGFGPQLPVWTSSTSTGLNLRAQMLRLCQLCVRQRFLPLRAVSKASAAATRGAAPSPTQDELRGSGSASATESWDGADSSLWLLPWDEHRSRSGRGSGNTSHLPTSNLRRRRSDETKCPGESPGYLVLRGSGGIYVPWAKPQREPVAKPRREPASWNSISFRKPHLCQPYRYSPCWLTTRPAAPLLT